MDKKKITMNLRKENIGTYSLYLAIASYLVPVGLALMLFGLSQTGTSIADWLNGGGLSRGIFLLFLHVFISMFFGLIAFGLGIASICFKTKNQVRAYWGMFLGLAPTFMFFVKDVIGF